MGGVSYANFKEICKSTVCISNRIFARADSPKRLSSSCAGSPDTNPSSDQEIEFCKCVSVTYIEIAKITNWVNILRVNLKQPYLKIIP